MSELSHRGQGWSRQRRHAIQSLSQRLHGANQPPDPLLQLQVDAPGLVNHLRPRLLEEIGVAELPGVGLALPRQLLDLPSEATTLGLDVEDSRQTDRQIDAARDGACGWSDAV